MERLNKNRDKIKVFFVILVMFAMFSRERIVLYFIFSLLSLIMLSFSVLSRHRREEILEHSVKYVLLTDVRFIRTFLIIVAHMILQAGGHKYYMVSGTIYWGIMFSILSFPEFLVRWFKRYSEKGGE